MLMCSVLAAQSTGDLYNKLSMRYGGLSTFQANVQQDNYFSQLQKSISYSGKLYFAKDRMLMAFSKPSVQRLYISNGFAELFDAGSATLFKSAVMPEFNKMNPIEILEHYWAKSDVKILDSSKGISRVELKPKNDPLIKSLEAEINSTSGLVSVLSYSDKSANKVTYRFTNILQNQTIDPAVWRFNYPKNTRVIEQ
ncbi:MAG: outer membrane lipoprotein carrier protein LolA [Candidatus Cloacimonetes bacterium]|nr:outer membrane lipoprotein carrier protein LolA [Candidatus Cloacimonadota bacterium]